MGRPWSLVTHGCILLTPAQSGSTQVVNAGSTQVVNAGALRWSGKRGALPLDSHSTDLELVSSNLTFKDSKTK